MRHSKYFDLYFQMRIKAFRLWYCQENDNLSWIKTRIIRPDKFVSSLLFEKPLIFSLPTLQNILTWHAVSKWCTLSSYLNHMDWIVSHEFAMFLFWPSLLHIICCFLNLNYPYFWYSQAHHCYNHQSCRMTEQARDREVL